MAKRTFPLVRVVDDNDDFRQSEVFMLRMMGCNVADYASALDFLENDDPQTPGLVILDVRMPEMDGLELQDVMNERAIGLPIIFLTGHGDIEMAVRAVQKGAVDFLQKPAKPEKLRAAVERALAKCEEKAAEDEGLEEARAAFEKLTEREKEVSRYVARGLLNKQIAFELGISEHTVKVHRASARYKLKARTPIDFVNRLKALGEI